MRGTKNNQNQAESRREQNSQNTFKYLKYSPFNVKYTSDQFSL